MSSSTCSTISRLTDVLTLFFLAPISSPTFPVRSNLPIRFLTVCLSGFDLFLNVLDHFLQAAGDGFNARIVEFDTKDPISGRIGPWVSRIEYLMLKTSSVTTGVWVASILLQKSPMHRVVYEDSTLIS